MLYDAIVVGGGFAGMSAALQIARARRNVLVIDSGQRRNRFASHAHGFLSRDGTPPGEIAEVAKNQLLAYPNVVWVEGKAVSAGGEQDTFEIRTEDGVTHSGRRVVLATGVSDSLPDVPGLAERWGRAVFHCPYCHGYELEIGTIGVLASHPMSIHQAEVVADWGSTILFTNGVIDPDAEQIASLGRRNVVIESTRVAEVVGDDADIRLEDGRVIELAGLFTVPKTQMTSAVAEDLGCEIGEGMTGPVITVDEMKKTSVDGVFACGDAARLSGNVALAVGDGAMAGAAAHQSLIFG
ncbi:NAD(P)/FAD-dependent oxidoreductase [Hoeflea sp. WL0058]|uniref:Thioredoxin reductase n=1 Tax=Flavimaribacter sediminis TaxID=2865987 RepID=A0AAE3CZX8_9HYPH|nr:NAD(P)/FAD-dependent oxidoreductase [Flavimaribacter sediminis]MBW8636186.1 NAD(P)/FAD-dependent oxidoreductase [Flavimaribacter sediminis]